MPKRCARCSGLRTGALVERVERSLRVDSFGSRRSYCPLGARSLRRSATTISRVVSPLPPGDHQSVADASGGARVPRRLRLHGHLVDDQPKDRLALTLSEGEVAQSLSELVGRRQVGLGGFELRQPGPARHSATTRAAGPCVVRHVSSSTSPDPDSSAARSTRVSAAAILVISAPLAVRVNTLRRARPALVALLMQG